MIADRSVSLESGEPEAIFNFLKDFKKVAVSQHNEVAMCLEGRGADDMTEQDEGLWLSDL